MNLICYNQYRKHHITLWIAACGAQKCSNLRFEYGVILKGGQTAPSTPPTITLFEYDVILKSGQTGIICGDVEK